MDHKWWHALKVKTERHHIIKRYSNGSESVNVDLQVERCLGCQRVRVSHRDNLSMTYGQTEWLPVDEAHSHISKIGDGR